MAEHYNTFLDPTRVRSPKDKGKVERDVQTGREKFKELTALYSTITPAELNKRARGWLRDGYGMTRHGTTHRMPYPVFMEEEQPELIPLPRDEFEPAFWREATVHPDCYIQVKEKSYSVPYQYVGKCRPAASRMSYFDNNEREKSGSKYRTISCKSITTNSLSKSTLF